MNCTNCEEELDLNHAQVEESARDSGTIEVSVECAGCGRRNYTFIPANDFTTDP